MYENTNLPDEMNHKNSNVNQMSFELLNEIMGKKEVLASPYVSTQSPYQFYGKKEKRGKLIKDRYIGTINQSINLNSLAVNTHKQTISKQKSYQLKSQKLQNTLFHLNQSISTNNSHAVRLHLQQISQVSTQNNRLNRPQPVSTNTLSPTHTLYPNSSSSHNLSFAPFSLIHNNDVNPEQPQNLEGSSLHFNRLINKSQKKNPVSFNLNNLPYSSTAMEEESGYEQDEIIEAKDIQEELQDEQNCKYIELLKRGIEESPLSKGSPFQIGSTQFQQKRKVLNFSHNEISDDMKKAFSMQSLTNINDKNNNLESMGSYLLTTISDVSETMHEASSSQNCVYSKPAPIGGQRNGQQLGNQSHPAPQVIDTIELFNVIVDDFYQNILDCCRIKRIAAMAVSGKIHLTDFKTQEKDSVLSNQMNACNMDYLPSFQQLHAQSSIRSLCFESSINFLSSQKKNITSQNRFDVQSAFSSTSLYASSQVGVSMNYLNMNQIDDNESQEGSLEDEAIEDKKGSYQIFNKQQNFTQDFILNDDGNDEGQQNENEEEDNFNISCFNLKTPSPLVHQNKTQQFNQFSSSQNFSVPHSVISPILPTNQTYYSVLHFSQSGHILAAGRNDGIVEIYDIDKKQCIFVARCHSKLITSISINHSYVATASQDSKVVIFDIRDISHIAIAGYLSSRNSSSILSIEWNPLSQNTLAASTESGHINFYNLIKNNKFSYKEIHLRESSIKTIAWNPQQRNILLAGSLDGYIFLVDLEKKQLLQRKKIMNHIYKIIFSPNQKDRFVCLTGNQQDLNNQQNLNQQQRASSTTLTNQDIIEDNFGGQTGGLFILSYPHINKIHYAPVGSKRVCQGTLSYDNSTLYTLSKDNFLKQWKIFREHQQDNSNSSILNSTQELR